MPQDWYIDEPNRKVIEGVVGGAVLDRLRGHKTEMADLYRLRGGTNATALKALQSYQDRVDRLSTDRHQNVLGGDYPSQWSGWNVSGRELTLIEQAVGGALMTRVEGGSARAIDRYTALGGDNAKTKEVLQKLAGA
jgi:hypothetical protein